MPTPVKLYKIYVGMSTLTTAKFPRPKFPNQKIDEIVEK